MGLQSSEVKITGDVGTLLAHVGTVTDPMSMLKFLDYSLEDGEEISVNTINEASKNGGLYIAEKGSVLAGFGNEEEKDAKYLIVPIGYSHKDSGAPLVASFFKNGSARWEGAFVGTLPMLIKKYQDFYVKGGHGRKITDKVRKECIRYHAKLQIVGFGGTAVIQYNNLMRNGGVSVSKGSNDSKKDISFAIEATGKSTESASKTSDTQTTIGGISVNTTQQNIIKQCGLDTSPLALEDSYYSLSQLPEADDLRDEYTPGTGRLVELSNEILNLLMSKEGWVSGGRNRLIGYISMLCLRVEYLRSTSDMHVGAGYILSNEKDKCLINTGLIDTFNNDIYIVDLSLRHSNPREKSLCVCSNRPWLVSIGFDKVHLRSMPSPVKFHNNVSELVFDGDIDEFDLTNKARLDHIITERRDRFPESHKNVPCEVLSSLLVQSVQKAVRMQQRDYKFILPMYNIRMNKVQYLVPFYLNEASDAKPSLAIIIGESNGFYCAFTILSMVDAYDNARVISTPDGSWLAKK